VPWQGGGARRRDPKKKKKKGLAGSKNAAKGHGEGGPHTGSGRDGSGGGAGGRGMTAAATGHRRPRRWRAAQVGRPPHEAAPVDPPTTEVGGSRGRASGRSRRRRDDAAARTDASVGDASPPSPHRRRRPRPTPTSARSGQLHGKAIHIWPAACVIDDSRDSRRGTDQPPLPPDAHAWRPATPIGWRHRLTRPPPSPHRRRIPPPNVAAAGHDLHWIRRPNSRPRPRAGGRLPASPGRGCPLTWLNCPSMPRFGALFAPLPAAAFRQRRCASPLPHRLAPLAERR